MAEKSNDDLLIEEIETLMHYAVDAEELAAAKGVLQKYKDDRKACLLFHEFYASLPEAREEPLMQIVTLRAQKGVHLLGVSTGKHTYLYCCSDEEAALLAECGKPIDQDDILAFFGYASEQELQDACADFASCDDYLPLGAPQQKICPVCLAEEGEYHEFGCPVEVCPWCDGQLSKCNCRFDKLDVDEITEEEQLEAFEEMLEQKGRLSYVEGQAPAYPTAGDDTVHRKK